MNIDFHNHFFPEAYIKELKKEKGYAEVKTDSQGRTLIYYSGDYNIVVGPHVDIKKRIEEMDKYDMDMQVLTLTTPGVEREETKRGIHLAKIANDIFSDIVKKHPDRFTALATLPLQEPQAAVDELRRAVKELGLSGAMFFTNVNNKTLDLKEFWPIYEEAVKLDVPLFIHPTTPIDLTGLIDYRLVPMLGFTLDTSLAVTRMIYGGVFDKYPSLKVVASHLGGTLPFLVGRIDTGYNRYPECKSLIKNPPSEYMKRIWVDSICYDKNVFMCGYSLFGPNKIVLGSDFPMGISDFEMAVKRIKDLKISEEDKEKILGENAKKLLGL